MSIKHERIQASITKKLTEHGPMAASEFTRPERSELRVMEQEGKISYVADFWQLVNETRGAVRPSTLKRFEVITREVVTARFVVEAESEEQARDLLQGIGPEALVEKCAEAQVQADEDIDDGEFVSITEVA